MKHLSRLFTLTCLLIWANEASAISLDDFIYNASSNFYEIHTTTDMQNLATYLKEPNNQCYGKTFKVMVKELDFSGVIYEPIGKMNDENFNVSYAFRGTFDGQGVIIKNLVIDENSSKYTGLFACLSQGSVENIILDKTCQISGIGYVGGIVGSCSNGTIKNCANYGIVINKDESEWVYAGGIVGNIRDYGTYTASVTECMNYGSVSGCKYVGGIVGMNHSNINNCSNYGEVYSDGSNIGGIVGSNQKDGTISKCTNKGNILGNGYIGGIVGYNYGTIHDNKVSICTITHSGKKYPGTGAILGGNNSSGILFMNYYDEDVIVTVNGREYSGMTPRGAGTGSAPTDIEKMSIDGETYYNCAVPSSYEGKEINIDEKATLDNLTFVNGCYEIHSPLDLVTLASYVNQGNNCSGLEFKITVPEIDFKGIDSFKSIGYYKNNSENCPFSGFFDGQNVTIKNLIIKDNDLSTAGLFGYGTNCGISNITLESTCDISGTMYIGGIIAYCKNGTITNCHNYGNITGPQDDNARAGGILGSSDESIIIGCSNEGIVSGGCRLGGITAFSCGTVSECINKGTIVSSYSGSYIIGFAGIAGDNYYGGTVINCKNYGHIEGFSTGGGIVGDNDGSIKVTTIESCTNYANVKCLKNYAGGIVGTSTGKVKECNNNGNIEGTSNVGGIIGKAGKLDGMSNSEVSDCLNTGDIIGSIDIDPSFVQGIGGIVGSNDNSHIKNCKVTGCTISGIGYVGAIAGSDYIGDNNSGNFKSNYYLSENYYTRDVIVNIGGCTYKNTDERGVGLYNTPFDVTTNNGAVVDKESYIIGDANGDNEVNSVDIIEITNYIMNNPSESFDKRAADVNTDGAINIMDILNIVNIIIKTE